MTVEVLQGRSRPGRRAGAIGFWAGAGLTGLFTAAALLSMVWTPWDPSALNIAGALAPPSWAHPFGVDQLGRDVLSLVIAGSRNALVVALAAVGLGLAGGVPLGLLAAARRGWVEELVMRSADIVFAFPALLSAVMIAAVLGPGVLNAILAIGVFNIPVFARLTRAAALPLWTRDWTLAARMAGKNDLRISLEHVLPNLAGLLVVQATIQFSIAIIAEAGLSYIGLGAQPPTPSWGRMLNDAQTLVATAPWLALFPGLAIALTVLGLGLLGEALRDHLAPRLRAPR